MSLSIIMNTLVNLLITLKLISYLIFPNPRLQFQSTGFLSSSFLKLQTQSAADTSHLLRKHIGLGTRYMIDILAATLTQVSKFPEKQ